MKKYILTYIIVAIAQLAFTQSIVESYTNYLKVIEESNEVSVNISMKAVNGSTGEILETSELIFVKKEKMLYSDVWGVARYFDYSKNVLLVVGKAKAILIKPLEEKDKDLSNIYASLISLSDEQLKEVVVSKDSNDDMIVYEIYNDAQLKSKVSFSTRTGLLKNIVHYKMKTVYNDNKAVKPDAYLSFDTSMSNVTIPDYSKYVIMINGIWTLTPKYKDYKLIDNTQLK